MRKHQLEDILSRRLGLDSPRFKLQKVGAKWSGHIISDSFAGTTDSERQKMLWDALEEELGAESVQQVGTLLAYSEEEWNIDLPAKAG